MLVATGKSLAQRAASNNSASIPTAPAAKDLATQLLELDGLHKSGVLTDEEFSAAKSRLLG